MNKMEITNETTRMEVTETNPVSEAAAMETEQMALEQQEMDAFQQRETATMAEQQEMDSFQASEQEKNEMGEQKMGYSSDYYKHEMERAIEKGNKIALENAKKNYARALVRENT